MKKISALLFVIFALTLNPYLIYKLVPYTISNFNILLAFYLFYILLGDMVVTLADSGIYLLSGKRLLTFEKEESILSEYWGNKNV